MRISPLLLLACVGCVGDPFTAADLPVSLKGPASDSATMTDAAVTPTNETAADVAPDALPTSDGGVTLPDAPSLDAPQGDATSADADCTRHVYFTAQTLTGWSYGGNATPPACQCGAAYDCACVMAHGGANACGGTANVTRCDMMPQFAMGEVDVICTVAP
jgi:hypothetical protein